MLTVEQAQEQILARAAALPSESVPLEQAHGRVLAEPVFALGDLPPFDNSAVDGYAVRAADVAEASEEAPAQLALAGEIAAGDAPMTAVQPGTAVRILTGAPMPPGADAVVMQEDTLRQATDFVAVTARATPGLHVRPAGSDIRAGMEALPAHTQIASARIGILAAAGRTSVSVFRRPRVAVVTTGDEVVELQEGEPLPPGKIRNSNRLTLTALLREAGAEVVEQLHIVDDLGATIAALARLAASGVDVIVSAGGVSVGDRDFIKPALESLGALELWRVRVRPGKPLAFGHIGATLFLGLPGNPASVLVTFELFVRPLLRKLAGHRDPLRPTITATVTELVEHAPGRREYVRAETQFTAGRFETRPAGGQDSHMLLSLARANSLLIVPEDSGGLAPGDVAEVLELEEGARCSLRA